MEWEFVTVKTLDNIRKREQYDEQVEESVVNVPKLKMDVRLLYLDKDVGSERKIRCLDIQVD